MTKKPFKTPHKQSGAATILIILVVGISMMALSMNVAHNVSSTQHKQIAVHATAHVQPLAWTGVEAFRGYLETLSEDQLKLLSPSDQNISINLSTVDSANAYVIAKLLSSPVVVQEGAFEYYQVSTVITAFDRAASASSTLNAVYYVAPSGGKNCVTCQNLGVVLDFHDDLDIGGGISVKAPAGSKTTFNVDGDVAAIHVSLNSINYLNSTGDIELGSAIFVDELYSNGTITLKGAASVTKASALGNINFTSSNFADYLYANGDITLAGVSTAKISMDALGAISIASGTTQGNATSGKDILISSTNGGKTAQAYAVGKVDLSSTGYFVDYIKAKGNMACPSIYWDKFISIQTGKNTINCPSNPTPIIPVVPDPGIPIPTPKTFNIQENASVSFALMSPLVPFTMKKKKIDAWQLKDYANYIFTYDGSNMKVLVKNVHGLEDGNYFISDYPEGSRGYRDFLCKELNENGKCGVPASPSETTTLCYGQATTDKCISYDKTLQKWKLDGRSFAPGTLWFEGNLQLANGVYYNTVMVSGELKTSNALITYAPNYAGYDVICNLNYPQNKNTTGDFDGLYPTNLCDATNSKMKYNAVANIALIAGGTPPGSNTYSGGDIDLGQSNVINGTVLAGEHLFTNGSTTVRGYISAMSQSGKGFNGDINLLGGATDIDLSNLPEGYDPSVIPPMDAEEEVNTSEGGGKGYSKLLWARYL